MTPADDSRPRCPSLTVVIVSFNTVNLMRDCLTALERSLARSGLGDALITVVDNASHDGTPEMIRQEFPRVQLLAQEENRGFAAANNLGLAVNRSPYVLLLNPDTEVLGDAPAALRRYLEAHREVGLVGGRLLYPDLTFQHSAFRFPTLPMSFLDFFPLNHRITNSKLNGRYPRAWYDRPFPIDHPLGAAMLVRREVIQRIGGFDEGFFMYCEEVDWCYRIRQAGWEIHYVPDAEIIHHGGASAKQNAGPMLIQLHRSRDRFFRKHYGPLFAGAARLIVRLGLARARALARSEARIGQIDQAELNRRLRIFDEVIA